MKRTPADSEQKIHSASTFNTLIAWIILLVALTLTGGYTFYTKQRFEKATYDNFSVECNELSDKVLGRLQSQAQFLRTCAAYIESSDSVSREEWETFISNQKIDSYIQGVQGIGYAVLIDSSTLLNHERQIRKSGFPEYKIKPGGRRSIYSSIIYLEPFNTRNRQAFGFDMFSEPVRRAAMEQARDSNAASLSGKVKLVQETKTDIQAGTLMYVPVYRNGMPINTMEERRHAIKGWVYGAYRMNDFMNGVSGYYKYTADKIIQLQIYDNDSILPEALLYNNYMNIAYKGTDSNLMTLKLPLIFNGKNLTLHFSKPLIHKTFYFYREVFLVLLGSVLISFLFFLLALLLIKNRYRLEQSTQLAVTLKANLDKQVALYNAIPDAIFLTDSKTGLIEEVNRKASEQYGYSDQELKTMTSSELAIASQSTELTDYHDTHPYFEQFHKKKNGKVFPVEITRSTFELNHSKKIISIASDITARKMAEESLHASEELYKTTINASPDAIIVTDPNVQIIMVSPVTYTLFGIENKDQILGINFKDLLAPQERDRATTILELMLSTIERIPLNFKCLYSNSNIIETEINSEVFRDIKGAPNGYIFVIRDITERKRTEDLLLATLKEKEILLREVHHRVKNNLQVVSSLLNLQASKIDDTIIKEALEQSRNRIRSIALVHEKLYQTGNYAEINLKEYTRSLLTELFRAYLVDNETIHIRSEIEDVNIPLIYAIPFGLILNEIISNSLKYAFPKNQISTPNPEIFINVKTLPDKQLQLSAGDNGIGLPINFELVETSTLGLYLIRILSTEQLDGKIEIDNKKGTIFTITFNPYPV